MAHGFKTGGRQKGTPNKSTKEGRENFQIVLGEELDSGRLQEALRQLSPKDYVAAVLKIMPFALSKARPEDCMEEPNAANEELAIEATHQENEKEPEGAVEDTDRPTLTAEEIERFRITIGWNDDQVKRFMGGEPFLRVNSMP